VIPDTVRGAARLVLAIIATLQVVVAVGGPWLDAWFERRSANVVAHVESTTADTCAALHDDDLCALCRELGRSKLNATRAATWNPKRYAAELAVAVGAGTYVRPFLGLPGSRAPPIA
jgi:hypothetical protein